MPSQGAGICAALFVWQDCKIIKAKFVKAKLLRFAIDLAWHHWCAKQRQLFPKTLKQGFA